MYIMVYNVSLLFLLIQFPVFDVKPVITNFLLLFNENILDIQLYVIKFNISLTMLALFYFCSWFILNISKYYTVKYLLILNQKHTVHMLVQAMLQLCTNMNLVIFTVTFLIVNTVYMWQEKPVSISTATCRFL